MLFFFKPGMREDSLKHISLLYSDERYFPPSLISSGHGVGALCLEVKQQGHEAAYSPLNSVEVKNGGAVQPLLQMY
jgi:hypothetical protein